MDATTKESTIENADIYFWNGSEDSPLVMNLSADEIIEGEDNLEYTLKAAVTMDELFVLASRKLQIFVVGNPSKVNCTLSPTNLPGNAKFSLTSLTGDPIGDFLNNNEKGKILPLVSAGKNSIDFSSITGSGNELVKAIIAKFTKNEDNEYVFDLTKGKGDISGVGKISLERAVARIDYKDADRTKGDLKDYTENVYPLGDISNHTLKLYSMKVANVSSSSYLFRHTIQGTKLDAFGVPDEEIKLFENENGGGVDKYNWIVSPYWEGSSKIPSFITESTTDVTIGISDLLSSDRKYDNDEYYPWCYVSENTIPTSEMMGDEKLPDYATRVEFTFQVCADKEGTVVNKTENGILSLTMPADHPTQPYYYQDINYDESKGGYFLTYYGYIKHNDVTVTTTETDPSDDTKTITVKKPGPMQYAIVRNNVYQLSVNSVSTLPNPNEPRSLYLQLNINIMPWNLRRNSFEF